MASTPLLWQAGARKEAHDLLVSIWTSLDAAGRDELSRQIMVGPPDDLMANIGDDERVVSRDRRVFDRISMLREVGDPPLTGLLQNEFARLTDRYPEWRVVEGERGAFAIWTEARWGPNARYGVTELKSLDDEALLGVLLAPDDDLREGDLDSWRELAANEPERVVRVLERLAAAQRLDRLDVWSFALRGLRGAVKTNALRGRLLDTLLVLPEVSFEEVGLTIAIADFLDEATSADIGPVESPQFWTLFDRAIHASTREPDSISDPEDGNWVMLAINTSLGRLATAFLNVLFSRKLLVGSSIPADLKGRLNSIVEKGSRAHRLARVIAASRLSYLFAVDPLWTHAELLPSFAWGDEDESISVWQGYAWQPRIDPSLWEAVKPAFLALFTHARLERLGRADHNLAQLFVLVATDPAFGGLPREVARAALRAMSDANRADAANWLVSYLEQTEESVDAIWSERIGPWIDRVWPRDVAVRSGRVAEQLSLAAIATDNEFPTAFRVISPHLAKFHAYYVITRLAQSSHPDQHPRDTLSLIDSIQTADEWIGDGTLQGILDRIRQASPEVAASNVYAKWHARLQAGGG